MLDGEGHVLDLGRRSRFFSEAQRTARIAERTAAGDPTCEHPTCDIPASWCHARHRIPWHLGGRSDLRDLELLCPRHHSLAHGGRVRPPMRT